MTKEHYIFPKMPHFHMAALILCDGSLHIHAKYNHFKGETNSIGYSKILRNYKLPLKFLNPLLKYKINLQQIISRSPESSKTTCKEKWPRQEHNLQGLLDHKVFKKPGFHAIHLYFSVCLVFCCFFFVCKIS